MVAIIQQYVSELIAGFAVLLSAAANWRVVRAEKEAKKTQKSIRRMDELVELERKNAAVGKLLLVTAQKILLLQKHPNLINNPERELERLKNNVSLLQGFQNNEAVQRKASELVNGGENIESHHKSLTDIRRLRVRIEADIEKETHAYNELLELSRN